MFSDHTFGVWTRNLTGICIIQALFRYKCFINIVLFLQPFLLGSFLLIFKGNSHLLLHKLNYNFFYNLQSVLLSLPTSFLAPVIPSWFHESFFHSHQPHTILVVVLSNAYSCHILFDRRNYRKCYVISIKLSKELRKCLVILGVALGIVVWLKLLLLLIDAICYFWEYNIYLMFCAFSYGDSGFLCFQKARSVRHCDIQSASNSPGIIVFIQDYNL